MPDGDLKVDTSGGIVRPRTQSPKAIRAWSQARDSFTRTVLGGIVLVLLTLAYVVALFQRLEGAANILVVIGSGLGFLLGSGRDRSPDSDN